MLVILELFWQFHAALVLSNKLTSEISFLLYFISSLSFWFTCSFLQSFCPSLKLICSTNPFLHRLQVPSRVACLSLDWTLCIVHLVVDALTDAVAVLDDRCRCSSDKHWTLSALHKVCWLHSWSSLWLEHWPLSTVPDRVWRYLSRVRRNSISVSLSCTVLQIVYFGGIKTDIRCCCRMKYTYLSYSTLMIFARFVHCQLLQL